MIEYDSEQKIWRGRFRRNLYNLEVPFGEILLDCMQKNPEKIIQINDDSNTHLSCVEIRSKTIRVANALTKMGFKKGDMTMIAAKSQPEMSPVFFGCFLIGAPINPIDVNFSKADVVHMVDLLRPKIIFFNIDQFEKIDSAFEEVGHQAHYITFGGENEKSLHIDHLFDVSCDEEIYQPPDLGDISKLPLAILCSSGTTGLPKGVCLPHALVNMQLAGGLKYHQNQVILSFSSPYWVSGFITLLMAPMQCCTRVVTTEPFSAKLFMHLIEKYRVTVIVGASIQFQLMLQSPDVHLADLSSLRLLLVGGSMVKKSLQAGLRKVAPQAVVTIGYGMTEFSGVCSLNPFYDLAEGCVGALAANFEGRIIDADDNHLEPNEEGVVSLRVRHNFLGYWNNEEATNSTISPEGWINTGDLGYFDDNGILYLTGRFKDMLKYMGYQIAPVELEAIIEKLNGVLSCCVVGINDPLYGDLPAAAVIKSNESNLTEEDIIHEVAQKVSVYKQLRGGVYFLDALPRTVSGKVKPIVVKEMLTKLYHEQLKSAE